MDDGCNSKKRMKSIPSPEEIKKYVLNSKEPIVFKNMLSWDLLNWTLDDWVEKLGNPELEWRVGTKQCTKVPQWESNCKLISIALEELKNDSNLSSSNTWMYFDYKHIKQYFKNKSEVFESVSWTDFGFPDKNWKDSTIWIGTQGAYTPCHMDSYGCNVVAQLYGRKLWVLFPPSRTAAMKPTRVPYEESSIYSSTHFSCGLNLNQEVGDAHVVELEPGDVLVVPNHWWHYVENLSTAISINLWLPLKSDDMSRLEESLVRFIVASSIKALEIGETPLLNPNEVDLLYEPVDLRQIAWCLERLPRQNNSSDDVNTPVTIRHSGCVSVVPTMSAVDLQQLLLKKCGCAPTEPTENIPCPPKPPLLAGDVISAFCHPEVIAKVSELLMLSRNN